MPSFKPNLSPPEKAFRVAEISKDSKSRQAPPAVLNTRPQQVTKAIISLPIPIPDDRPRPPRRNNSTPQQPPRYANPTPQRPPRFANPTLQQLPRNSTVPQPIHAKFVRPRTPPTVDKSYRKPTRLTKNPFSTPSYNSSSSSLASLAPSISEKFKFSLAVNPNEWDLSDHRNDQPEADDYLHNPDPNRDRRKDRGGSIFNVRAITNLGCVIILIIGLVAFFAGYPLLDYFLHNPLPTFGGYNLGGINDTGQIPTMTGGWSLIDRDTPKEAYTKPSYTWGGDQELQLVFSDEFNVDGRTFYPGDDPYWEAVDLHYWGTNNLEWYDPAAITTKDGNLVIKLDKKDTHGLKYEGGLLASWNKFCFTGGLLEVSAVLPGSSDIYGLWPAIWALGNLGRAGYGATLDGMWPYTYDTCDVGTLKNQTLNGQPAINLRGNDKDHGGRLSFLPGQRLSACTCEGEIHPGPRRKDGNPEAGPFVGRGAPEIDILEATVDKRTRTGHISQSGQWAPFDARYVWKNTTENMIIHDPASTKYNSYIGGIYQQCTSGLVTTDQDCYEHNTGCHSVYGFEYRPGNDGYITWISNGKSTWTLMADGMGPNPTNKIGQRPVPQEPLLFLYSTVIANLGMSYNFGDIAFKELKFPVHMMIDYIRVYQPKDQINIGCDPKDFPTQDYINTYIEAYTNPNITTWAGYGQKMPKNKLIDNC